MYSKINLTDAQTRTRSDTEPAVKALGYEIRNRGEPRPEHMRFNYFQYEEGDTVGLHTQEEQEELFFVVSGTAVMTVEDESFEIEPNDVIVVDPGPWREIIAKTDLELFVVGAPNVRDDAVFEDDTVADSADGSENA